ncbi:MAG: carboxy terminal-processing peptidase, partial [Firmicutes bacterium]|nr:carboxy terminal-processing peptidase [Bacillota bacterium]
ELQELKTRSARRIAANPNFAAVQRYIEQVKAEKEQSLVSLQLDKFLETQRAIRLETEKLDDLKAAGTDYLYRMLETPGMDPDRAQINQEWLGQLREDFYLEETIQIMLDLIEASSRAEAA